MTLDGTVVDTTSDGGVGGPDGDDDVADGIGDFELPLDTVSVAAVDVVDVVSLATLG